MYELYICVASASCLMWSSHIEKSLECRFSYRCLVNRHHLQYVQRTVFY
jgi:hypothetical protein